MATAVTALAKVAIPLGVGLVFLAAKRGGASPKPSDKAVSLTTRAVQALQGANASQLEDVANDFRSEGDPTTADLLMFQQGRMVSRDSRGATDVPRFTDDPGLSIDNQEIVPRFIQLEGRIKALRAWAKAYKSIGAKNASHDLELKAKQLEALSKKDKTKSSGGGKSSSDSKAEKDKAKEKSSGKGKAETPDLEDVVKQVTDALASGSVETMRKVAADLRSHGFTEQADSLDAAADELEAEQEAARKAEEDRRRQEAKDNDRPAPKPQPEPEPNPSHRTVTVKSGDSESAIAKRLTGNANLWPELVSINIPKDADGRSRSKVTAADVANGVNPNRMGALKPGLQPGQNLFVPDDWKLKANDTKPAPQPKPAPKPSKPAHTPDTGDALTTQLITMLAGKSPGQEDTFLVKKWQSANGRTSDGKFGPGDALFMADSLGVVPPTPLYWPKNNTAKALSGFHADMARLALEHPEDAEAYHFADSHAYQPGFEGVPLGRKIVSRRLGDGLRS